MEIHIKGHDTIQGLLKEEYRKFDVVLYTNSDYEVPRFIETHCKEMIHLPVDDCEFARKTQVVPSLESVKKALDWSLGRDKLICCCHAGVSRSSSTAYLIASREWGPKAALSILRPHRHWPNRLIVYLGSQLLNDPSIWTTFAEWQKKETGLDPSDNGAYPLAKVVENKL
jgi:predicted protein tyrosine phosphatase